MPRLLQHPVVLLLLCFSLVGAPVTYRGGASNPHPHMFLEFLMDAGAGSFDHHHGSAEAPREGEHNAREHRHESDRQPESPTLADAPERFGASISAFVVGDIGQSTLMLPDHALPRSDSVETAFFRHHRTLYGITHSPAAPPPR